GGLEIDALGGEPGIYSARYAGEDKTDAQKVAFVLDKLKGVAENDRAARFVVVLALAQPGKEIKFFQGELEGSLSLEPRGTPHKQLPYRQLFIPEGYSYTLDELDDRGISYVSHRQKAVNKVVQALKD
ncbi:MAG: non-canonical purine NTP pyrophosphatase, partial [Candidatus Babeliales bacterium]